MVKLIQLTIAILLTFIVTTTSSQAHSHNRSQSFSDWEITDNIATAVFTAKSREITRLQSQSNQLALLAYPKIVCPAQVRKS